MTKPSDSLVDTQRIYRIAAAALCCAAIAAGSYISVPAGPVPFTLQTMFVLLTGLVLIPGWAAAALGAYLLMGGFGLPVFSAGSGGVGHLLGPTGGYLWAFLPAAVIIAWLQRVCENCIPQTSRIRTAAVDLLTVIVGTLIIYAGGVTQLAAVTGMAPGEAVAAGMLPFLMGDVIKMAAAVACAALMRPLFRRRGI
ncbi:biotin transporter BioY [Spirochaeta africana]|uniref:Biotin transporter n=1 Tax=Spirochaeta africana (strain ATCC 700263 / DSM 8902 / Z-7692) TaxID=889378 RepID=H9UHS6_SPIAZ|nr:biotin transporter BioY [Spirochaeta africana]AFG37069.1 hypothetical protein Spiaf_0981 [Spirochaeta africana DSM 8902]